MISNILDPLPDFVGYFTAPNAAQQIVELGILSSKLFHAINELRALFGKQVLKRPSGQNGNGLVRQLSCVGSDDEVP